MMPIAKGTPQPKIRGASNGRAKLTERQALELRRLVRDGTVSARRAALVLGMHPSTVEDLASGKNWGYLDNREERVRVAHGAVVSPAPAGLVCRLEPQNPRAIDTPDGEEDTDPDKFGGVVLF